MENFLALKTGDSYIREKDGVATLGALDKAKVFPESSFTDVLARYRILKKKYPQLAIVRLVVTIEQFYKE